MARDKKSNKSKRKRGKKFRVFEQNVKNDAIQGKLHLFIHFDSYS
jgi:hypothetical protein